MSVGHTFYYAIFTVPLTVAAALLIAVLLNSKIKGIVVYRTAVFLSIHCFSGCRGRSMEHALYERCGTHQ